MLAIGFPLMLIGIVLLVRAAGRQRDRNVSNASEILANLFDGSPQVSYTSTWGIGLPPAELLPGATPLRVPMTTFPSTDKAPEPDRLMEERIFCPPLATFSAIEMTSAVNWPPPMLSVLVVVLAPVLR